MMSISPQASTDSAIAALLFKRMQILNGLLCDVRPSVWGEDVSVLTRQPSNRAAMAPDSLVSRQDACVKTSYAHALLSFRLAVQLSILYLRTQPDDSTQRTNLRLGCRH